MRPKKRLGQNFLINHRAAERIASSLELKPGDRALEIGAGRGDLTVHLVKTGASILAVEFDKDLIEILHERFAGVTNLQVVQADILEFDVTEHLSAGEEISLIGNLPYNITSPIIEWIIDRRQFFPRAVMMIQREVAERIAAVPGNKDFGSLTIFVQLFYHAERLFDLSPGSFKPKPKVSSSVLRWTRRSQPLIEQAEYPILRRLTSACFRWRRKQLIRILRDEYNFEPAVIEKVLQSLEIAPTIRPEQLPVDTFVTLSRRLNGLVKQSESPRQ